jgi:hypothetical protein
LGTGSGGAFGVVARCVVGGDDLAAVVGHASDQDQCGGDDRDEGGDAASFVAGVHDPLR